MKTSKRFTRLLTGITPLAALLAASTALVSPTAQAASITKLGAGTDLTDGASWNGSVSPASSDVAVWNTGSLGAGLTLNSGVPSWLGIQVAAGATDPINIGSGGTLTLGTSGINMSASTINATFGCGLSLASGYQSWSVASGKTLAINGALNRTAGASMSFPTAGVTSTVLPTSNGIIGGWATVTGTADWASTNSSGNVITYASYTSVTGSTAPNAAQNWKTTGNTTLSASGTINSANVVGGDLGVAATTLTLGSGGLIMGSTERWVSGTGGTIKSGLATGELYIHANTAAFGNGFQIQPIVTDGLVATVVTKDGSGQMEMGNGNNTFSGGFYLNAGAVYLGANSTGGNGSAVTSGPLGTGTVTLNGGKLVLGGKANGTFGSGSGYTEGNNLVVPVGVSAVIDGFGGNGGLNGNLSGGGTLTLQSTLGTALSFGLGSSVDWSGFTGTLNYNCSGTLAFNIQAGAGNLDLSHAAMNFSYSGSANSSWRTGSGFTTKFGSLSGNAGAANANIQNAGTIEIGNLGSTTTFAGFITGAGAIKVVGGALTLSGVNTYTGPTTINAGGLTIGGAGQLASGNYAGTIVNNGFLTYNSSAAQTLSGPISGSGSLTNNGSGTLTLTGASSYTGNTTVNAGKIVLAGPQLSSQNNVAVADGVTLNETFSPATQLTATSLSVGTSSGATLGFVVNSTSAARLVAGTLTRNGTDTINILGGNLVAGNSYPLIAYTTLAGSGSFALTMPIGVAGNLSTSGNTIYFNVTGITNTVWTGLVNGTWDINTTANWTNPGTLGNKYIDGSVIQFDDTGLNSTTISNSVATTLTPAGVLVTNSTLNYNFKANTIIAGFGALIKTGTAALTNSTPNTYTGPTVINQGSVVAGVASVANVSGAAGNNSPVTLGTDATATLNLNNFATQIGSLTGGGTTGGNVVLGSATLTVGGDNSSPAAYGGAISGTGGLTKIGTGTLTLSGTNVYSGTTLIAQGKVVLNGNGTLGAPGAGFIRVGNTTGQAGAMYQSGANTVVSNSTAGAFIIANAAGSYGYYNLASGTINSLIEIDPANGGTGDFGQFDMSGGTVNISSNNPFFLPCRNGVGESSVVNISGGTVQIAGGGAPADNGFNGLSINWGNTGAADTNTTTISGSGQFLFPTLRTKLNVGSSFNGTSGNSANVCALNLNGGVLQTLGFLNGAANNPNVNLNFNGGTLKAGATANAAYLSGLGGLYLYGNGGTFDNNGVAIGIGQTFSSPTASGVASIAVSTAGSGYIVPPQVTISGDGAGATAYSTIDPASGVVTGIIVTCPGTGYSTATASLAGGGGVGASAGTVTLAANTSGPMTFTGAGITTLSGAYYATGGINVAGGILSMNTANGVPSPAGDLTVSNATLTLNASGGTPLPANNVSARYGSTVNLTPYPYANGINAAGNLVLGTNVTLNLIYGGVSGNPSSAAINVAGSLTKGTNIVINISAGGLSVGLIPLITTGSAVTTNNFTLGTLPPGIKAVLTNNTATSLDLLITGAGQLLSWHGANADNSVVLTNWDINTSINWYDSTMALTKYLQYSGNSYGDNVTFGDNGYNTDGTNEVTLNTTVVPATVTFSPNSYPYRLFGSGGISGATSVLLTNGSAATYLETSNSYTGGTILESGTLVITNDNALGAPSGGISFAGGALQLNNNVTDSRSATMTANTIIGVITNASASLNGAIVGSGTLTKNDNGTLTLAGTSSTFGATVLSQGTLNLSGVVTNSSSVTVGNVASLNVNLGLSGNLNAHSLLIGNVGSVVASVVQSGGNSIINGGGGDCMSVGNISGAYGYYKAVGGTLTVNGIAVGGEANTGTGFSGTGGDGLMEITGGTVNDIGWLVMARGATAESGVLNVFSGSLAYQGGGLSCNWGTGQTSIVNIMGGLVTSTNAGVSFRNAGNTGILNLNGGVLQGTAVTGAGVLNFNGGTLRPAASFATPFLNLSSNVYVYSGGAAIDDNSQTITISQPLLAPVGAGVSTISLSDGGSGYVVPPIVAINGGSGSNATAIASVSGGVITGITVTSPGNGYVSGVDEPSMSLTFTGGGANATPPSSSTFTLVANTSGGLTKLGSGILTLSGANTYAGSTMVTNGTLLFTPAQQAGGSVVVANNAKFGVSASSVSNSATIGALTLGSGASGASTLDFTYGFVGNPTNAALTAGAVVINGTNTIQIVGTFGLGTFPVLNYASLSGTLNSTVSAPRGMGASVSNDTVHKVIYVVVNSLSSPIVWTGTNSIAGKTNLWDLNTTTNWLIAGSPTTYQETLPPGDAVIFNDIGNGLVLLSNTASPASVIISNTAVNYTFQGSGQINSAAGLTKVGSGTVTLNLPGTYSVSTVVSNGTINLGTNQTFANLSGNGTVGTASGAPTLTGNNTANTTFSGSLQGALNLTKTGNSTLTLTGTNTFSGNVFGKGGTMIIDNGAINGGTLWTSIGQDGTDNATLTLKGTGLFTNNADFNVGDIGSAVGTVNISNNASLLVNSIYVASANAAGSTASGTVNQAGGTVKNQFLVIGGRAAASTNGVGVYNLSGGSLTVASANGGRIGNFGTGTLNISGTGAADLGSGISYVGYRTGYGKLNMTGGSLSAGGEFRVAGSDANGTQYIATGIVAVANATVNLGSLTIARGNNNQNSINGEVYINSGATVTSTNDVVVGFAGTGHGKLALGGGTLNVGTIVTKWMIVPQYDTTTAEVNITNGALNLNASSCIRFSIGNTSTAGTPNVINQEGGAVTFYSDFATTIGGVGVLDMAQSGAASVVNTYNLDGGILTVPQVLSATTLPTRIFNFNGGTLKAAGSSTAFFNLGTGNAFAYVRNNGAVIDTAGNDVTIAQALLNNGIDEDGGLTKNGNGTLLLNGVNTYTNVTTVNAGTLGGTGTIAGALTINSTAGLAPGNGIGTLTINGNLTLNAGSTNVFEVNGSTPANDRVVAGGAVNYGGVLSIVPAGSFTAGQQFLLFTGAGATNASNFASLAGSPGTGLGFTFTNGVLSVVTTMASNPTNITFSVSGSTLSLGWPEDHRGWILQSQTNNLSVGLTTNNWFDVAGSTTVTNEVITVNPAAPTVFYRLKMP